MALHVGELNTEVTVIRGELPLTEDQLRKLVKLVAARLERDRTRTGRPDPRAITNSVAPPIQGAER